MANSRKDLKSHKVDVPSRRWVSRLSPLGQSRLVWLGSLILACQSVTGLDDLETRSDAGTSAHPGAAGTAGSSFPDAVAGTLTEMAGRGGMPTRAAEGLAAGQGGDRGRTSGGARDAVAGAGVTGGATHQGGGEAAGALAQGPDGGTGTAPAGNAGLGGERSTVTAGDAGDHGPAGAQSGAAAGTGDGKGGYGGVASGGTYSGGMAFGGSLGGSASGGRTFGGTGGSSFGGTGGSSSGGDASGGSPPVVWSETDLGLIDTGCYGHLVVGDGRGDTTNRVYVGDSAFLGGNIYEYTFAGGSWTRAPVGSEGGEHINGLHVADVHNDGSRGIYVTEYGLTEYRYTGAAWEEHSIGAYQWNNGISLGVGRNDGYLRLYLADADVVEVSYDYGDWSANTIDTGEPPLDTVVAPARNDGLNRLYAVLGIFYGSIWEFEYDSVSETYALTAAVSDSTGGQFQMIRAGSARGDGQTRLYAWGEAGLYEFSFGAGAWTGTRVTNVPYEPLCESGGGIVIADGRNDGQTRLYTADANGLGEYSFSSSWKKTGLITAGQVLAMGIGPGRNDGLNRLYATRDNNLYEYVADL
ncbi:MAG: hypothetical protein JW940_01215 [Polyangiaceae bacterium]|nr:hypothetical protein [Polyangiaceae bacterium]